MTEQPQLAAGPSSFCHQDRRGPQSAHAGAEERPLEGDELDEAILDWIRDRFDRWPIEALHLNARRLADEFGVSRNRADCAIRALARRRQIEPAQRSEDEVAAGVPFLHRLVER